MGRQSHPLFAGLLLTVTAITLSGCAGVGGFDFPETHHIRMWVEEMDWELHPGVTTKVWAFCAEGDAVEPVWDGPCGVPGPTIRVREGDRLIIEFQNTHTIPHTVHFHGMHPFAADMNGNGILGDAMVADAGETETIEWVADPAGSFIYHCHFDTPTHMDMGMYGAFIVEPRDAKTVPDHEYVAILDEWQVRDENGFVGNIPDYNYFTINGRSFPTTQVWYAEPGESVRVHMVNAGYEFHAMHLHGYIPDSYEGASGPDWARPTDVREIAPGQTVVLDIDTARPGVWLFHDHVVPRVTAGSDGSGFGAYPRGMLTAFIVGQEYLDAVQAAVPALLEAAGNDAHDATDHSHDAAPAEPQPAATEPTDPAAPDPVVVRMQNFAFDGKDIEVEVGTKVVWSNKDGAYHTVTFEDGSVDSGEIQAGKTWSHTFTEPGTYKYYCKPHAAQNNDGAWQGMIGTVVVA